VISREGSVEVRRALIDLGIGPWLNDAAAKRHAAALRARGKNGLVIACVMAYPGEAHAAGLSEVRRRSSATRCT